MDKKYIFIASVIITSIIGIASSDGVAEDQNRDRTGSPDGSNTCVQCHNSGSFNTQMNITVTNDMGMEVDSYVPGELYTLSFSVATPSPPFADEYGFQSTVLADSDLSNAGEFLDPGANVQLQFVNTLSIDNRHIAEHSAPAPVGQFTVGWQAPSEDIGDVTIYASGIAANGNGASSGDQGANLSLTLSPGTVSSLESLNMDELVYIVRDGRLQISGTDFVWDRLEVFDMSGRMLIQENRLPSPVFLQLPEVRGVVQVRLIKDSQYVSRSLYLP